MGTQQCKCVSLPALPHKPDSDKCSMDMDTIVKVCHLATQSRNHEARYPRLFLFLRVPFLGWS